MASPLTAPEVARRLRWTPQYVRRLASAHRLPGVKVRRTWLFDSEALEAWIEAGGPDLWQRPDLYPPHLAERLEAGDL